MSLKPLLKSGEVKIHKAIKKLDYSNLDPSRGFVKQELDQLRKSIIDVAELEASNLIKDAEEKVERMLYEAQEKSNSIVATSEAEVATMQEKHKKELENYLEQDKVELEQERHTLAKEKELYQQELEVYKKTIRKEIETEVWETLRLEIEKKIEEDFKRLIDQIHEILNVAISKRREILGETERDISDLVILIARKVVKVLSEKDQHVVVQNIIEAMNKLKGREKFIIRVNLKNLQGLEKYIPKIKEQFEVKGNIILVEDTKIDVGGCIIETEFGEIDARISTQLAEIEKRIRDTELIHNVRF